ncbi:MAG: hypothetical protein R2734_15165, partial [Nocardioides sp.]
MPPTTRRTPRRLALLLAVLLGSLSLLTASPISPSAAAACRPGVAPGKPGSCTIVVSIVGAASMREGAGKALRVRIRPASHPAFVLLASTRNGTARAPGDYRRLDQRRVRVAADARTARLRVRALDDAA